MRADERALADLAASVADGDVVDWGAAEARSTAEERRLVRHLQLVDRIASLHRTIPAEPEDDVQAPADGRLSQPEPSGPRWGRLVVLEPIGRGTSAEVFRAWDTELHRDVALKLLKSDGGADAAAHARVLQEARRLARIRHAHVVHVYGAEQHEQRVGLWMELVRGESLEEIVRTRGALGAAEASIVGRDLASAIASVHAAGLLHRDLKAQNVVRESGGRIVLMAFGTGEELRDAGGSARLTGTPLYLAPEVFSGGRASVQSDLYSLGVLLFFLVTGEYPVTADSHEGLARAHRERRARRLRDLRPDLPQAFVAAVERALAPDPAARFRTAGEMEAALRDVVGDRAASTDRRPQRGLRWWAAAAVLLLCAALAAIFWSRRSAERPPADQATSIDSLAVLPLADVSGADAHPQLAEALTDQLIATIGQIGSLRVAARTSVTPFQNSGRSASEIARLLGVDALVEGTIAIAGDAAAGGRVRVNARLIAAGSGAQLWSRSLERPLGDTLRLQAELAQEIARTVRATITPGESQRLAQTHATSAQAEQAYFQGRYHLGQYGVQRARRALEAFNRAVQLDPNHAAARAGAARSYFALGSDGAMSQAEARTRALDEITRARAIDPDQEDALVALGDLKFRYDWDWAAAEAAYQRAIEVNGSFSYARGQFSRFLAAADRLDEAVEQARTAAQLDPLSADTVQTLGLAQYYKRDYQGAVRSLERALELDPRSARAHAVLSRVRDAQGDHAAAIGEMRRAIELAEEPGAAWRMQLIRLQAAAGRRDDARAQFRAFSREAERRGVRIAAEHLGYLALTLGDQEQALAHLERAVEERDPAVLWLAVDPRVDPLRQHARFQTLVAKLGMP